MVTCQPFSASPRSVIDALVIVSGFGPAQPPKEIPGCSLFSSFFSSENRTHGLQMESLSPLPFEPEPRLSETVGDEKGNMEKAMLSR